MEKQHIIFKKDILKNGSKGGIQRREFSEILRCLPHAIQRCVFPMDFPRAIEF
jgi:hypothetical protein